MGNEIPNGFVGTGYPSTTEHVRFIENLFGIGKFAPHEWAEMKKLGRTEPPFYG